jgi:signal transduction histidine kinase/DNA-binding response OmpR family regulator
MHADSSLQRIYGKCFLLLLIFFCIPNLSFSYLYPGDSSRTEENGLPFIKNFDPAHYLHLTANNELTALIQDNSGRMLIGSNGGILIYNGNTWQLTETPEGSMVWALAKDEKGRIYAGAAGDFGYLASDPTGKTTFVSLLSKLPQQHRSVGDVWQTVATPEGVYFISNQYLMRWHNEQIKVWKAEKAFAAMHWIAGELYVQMPGGLHLLKNDVFELFSPDEVFVKSWTRTILPLDNQRWLVGTYTDGLYFFDGKRTIPLSKPVSSFVKSNICFNATLLPDSTIGITTLKGGLVIIDQEGNIKGIYNKEQGLASNTVYAATTDKEGGLWLSQEKGLSRIQLNAAFSLFNDSNGLIHLPNTMCMHQGKLYAGTNDGLFALEAKPGLHSSAAFRKVTEASYSILDLESAGNSMLMACKDGLFEWKNGKLTNISIANVFWENFAQDIEISSLDTSVAFIASRQVVALRRQHNGWQKVAVLPGLPENCRQMVEMPSGELWLLSSSGLARVRFPGVGAGYLPDNLLSKPSIDLYGPEKGLPHKIYKIYQVGGQLLAQSGEKDAQLYQYLPSSNSFKLATSYGSSFGISAEQVHPASVSSTGQYVWLWSRKAIERGWQPKLAIKQSDGHYQVKAFPLNGSAYLLKDFFFEQPGKAVWFSSTDGLVRMYLYAARDKIVPFRTLLEGVVAGTDSVLYPSAQVKAQLSFDQNSLRFAFAAPSYEASEENKFQYYLEGFDADWSSWTKENFKEYTRIPEGKYTFHVRAMNARGHIGQEATYAFSILPPFYRTGYMYVFYLLLAAGAIYGLIRWRSSRLETEKTHLESVIAQRTKEIAEKNEQLSRQTRQLQELDGAKSRFFANISHEFRTPLTIILNSLQDKLSFLRQHQEQSEVEVSSTELGLMSRNASRLLGLINQLLDISKIESGKMNLELQNGNLQQLLQVSFASFASMATHRQIHFELEVPGEPLLYRYDEDKLEKILYNLLSNAFKFTPNGGNILLKAEVTSSLPNTSKVRISVQDNGPGIAPGELENIFDRFYQGKQYYTDAQGTGIGLALSKELAELHGGRIWAESQPGKGALFVVELSLLPSTGETLHAGTSTPDEYTLASQFAEATLPSGQLLSASPVSAESQEELPLVLIAEDNEDLRTYIRRHLANHYRIKECENGVEALAIAQELIPDLIISDWMMPRMDGLELCGHLKNDTRTSHIPVILLTALATHDAKMRGLQQGADDYLTKPFSTEELDRRISNLIENRRKLREHFSREIRLEPTRQVVASVDEKFLQRVMQVVEERMGDADFSVDELSREVGLSRVHLHRKMKALTGESASDFIRMMRLKRAAQLLDSRAGNIAEVAYQVGFNTLSYFSKCFKEQYGLLPNEYIRKGTLLSE